MVGYQGCCELCEKWAVAANDVNWSAWVAPNCIKMQILAGKRVCCCLFCSQNNYGGLTWLPVRDLG